VVLSLLLAMVNGHLAVFKKILGARPFYRKMPPPAAPIQQSAGLMLPGDGIGFTSPLP
jgi:hypothetical protein